MQFREFNIIAAAAYAAHYAAAGDTTQPTWDELSELAQSEFVDQTMKIARGEGGGPSDVYRATVSAIFKHNNGQGGLALEKIALIGNDHFNLGLVTEAEVAGRDIAEVNNALLQELAGLRNTLGSLGVMSGHYARLMTAPEFAEVEEPAAEPEAETVQ